MMINSTADIEHQITQTFDQLSTEVKSSYIGKWSIEIYSWLNRARAYVAQQQSMMEKLSKNSLQSIEDFQTILKNRRVAKKMIDNKTILTDGYVLLNKIGETIRAEEIYYSVTVSKTGSALTSGAAGTGGVYTWKVPLSQFINLLNFTSTRIVLKDSSTIYKMLETQIEKGEEGLVYEKWSEEKLQSFSIFANQVRGAANGYWSKVNEGNILEAFFRFLNGNNTPAYDTSDEYWISIMRTMKQTMMAPDPFYVGGDLNDLQIKGLNASVTNINTLIQRLQEVLNILTQSQSGYDVLRKYVRQNCTQQLEQSIVQDQNQIANNLIEFFTSKVDRNNVVVNL